MTTVIRKQGLVIMTSRYRFKEDLDKLRERLEREIEDGLVILEPDCKALTYDQDMVIVNEEED